MKDMWLYDLFQKSLQLGREYTNIRYSNEVSSCVSPTLTLSRSTASLTNTPLSSRAPSRTASDIHLPRWWASSFYLFSSLFFSLCVGSNSFSSHPLDSLWFLYVESSILNGCISYLLCWAFSLRQILFLNLFKYNLKVVS